MTTIVAILSVLLVFGLLTIVHAALVMYLTKDFGEKELEDYYAEVMRQNYLNNKNNLL